MGRPNRRSRGGENNSNNNNNNSNNNNNNNNNNRNKNNNSNNNNNNNNSNSSSSSNNNNNNNNYPMTRSHAREQQRNDSQGQGNNFRGLTIGTGNNNNNNNNRMEIDSNTRRQDWNNGPYDNRNNQNNQNFPSQRFPNNQNNPNSWDSQRPNRHPGRGNDGQAVDNNNPRKRLEPVKTRFSDRDIARTLAEAKRLLREFRTIEARVNSFIPRDNRALWRFMNIQKKGLNAVKMCYYLHHAILNPEGDYDMDNETAKLCDCNNTDSTRIPECYLLAMFYLICATNYESGLFNFSSPLTAVWPGKRGEDTLADTMMIVPVGEQEKKEKK